MKPAPLDIGVIHFVGIGGIGMSGIAEVMHNLGYKVRGSDVADSANVKRLRALGISVDIGHAAENIAEAQVLVVSTAIKPDNPELVEARARMMPIVRRAEMLAELMRLKSCIAIGGTHGKTTTTSMVASILDAADFDPTVINGGIINAYGTNARLGGGDWMVVEADESDGTFLKLPSTIAVVTNVDPEHLDHYGSFDAIRQAFLNFVESVPFYGFAVMCIDHPEVQALIGKVKDRWVVTYGTSPQADVRASNIRTEKGVSVFDVPITKRRTGEVIDMPEMMTSNLPDTSAGMIPSQAVGMNSTSTPISSASWRPTSSSKPIRSPFLSRMDHGTNSDRPILMTPRCLMVSITLSEESDARVSCATDGSAVAAIARAPMAAPKRRRVSFIVILPVRLVLG